jgi:hypothetical protein
LRLNQPVLLAHLLLIPWRKVKKLLGWGLLGIAVMYFYGYAPPDLLPSFPTIHTSGAKVRASEVREQAPAATPQRNAVTTTVTKTQDGSLANRWKP